MRRKILIAISTSVLIACSAPAFAQVTTPAPGSNDAIPEKIAPAPEQGRSEAPRGSLSNKLQQSNGVIAPSGDVDPSMRKPAPDINTGGSVLPAPGPAQGVEPK